MPRTAIQLFTLRDVNESLATKLGRVADTNFEGVEFAGLDGEDPSDLADRLDELELDVAGAHVRIDSLEEDYDAVTECYSTLGCRRLVIPTYDGEAFTTRAGVEAAAERLSSMAADLADDGFDLYYHNHTFEFGDLGGETAFDAFVDALDDSVRLELDIGLARFAGADPARLLERYADRIDLLHVTDSRTGSDNTVHVELGAGQVDLEGCVAAACDLGVDWLIYEHGRTSDPLASLAHSDSTLSAMLGTGGIPTESTVTKSKS